MLLPRRSMRAHGAPVLAKAGRATLRAAALLLPLLAGCVWVSSYRTSVMANWYPPGGRTDVYVGWTDGLVGLHYIHTEPPQDRMEGSGLLWHREPASSFDRVASDASWNSVFVHVKWESFVYATMAFTGYSAYYCQLPFWAVFAVTLAPAAIWLCGWRRRVRRRLAGRCVRCGYDLRASTGRCPECGTPISSGAGTKPGRMNERNAADEMRTLKT